MLNLFPLPLTPAQLLSDGLPIKVWWQDATLFCLFSYFFNIHTFIQSQYIHPLPFAEASLHFFIACMLSGDNLPVVPSRESNSGLPYSKPTRCKLSHAAPYWATPHHSEPRRTITEPRRTITEPRRTIRDVLLTWQFSLEPTITIVLLTMLHLCNGAANIKK